MARVLLWFRKGLRLHDNPALIEALKGKVLLFISESIMVELLASFIALHMKKGDSQNFWRQSSGTKYTWLQQGFKVPPKRLGPP